MTNTIPDLDPPALQEILVSDVGIDPVALAEQPHAVLSDLGLDSMAQVELGVVLHSRHGVKELPEDAHTMSFSELANHLCGLST